MALCSEKVKRALNQVSCGLCYFTAEGKHAQLLDVQKTLSEIVDALASPDAATQPPGRTGMTWEGIVIGLRAALADESEDAIQRVWQRSRILDAFDLIEANGFGAATQSGAGVLNNETSDYRRGREDGLAEGYLRGEADAAARADSKISPKGPALPSRVLDMCKKRGWDLSWSSRGVYLHLEASELIEALRGKHGDPLSEAADVLLVLMSITENAGIPWGNVLEQTAVTCARLEVCDPYPGEERGALAQSALSDALIQAECALSDIAEGEETNAAPNTFKWAEQRCAETLATIRPVMRQHKICNSEWPPAAQPAQSAPTAAPPANGESEYTDSEWAEINRWGQSDVVAQPASPVLPAGGLVKSALHAFWKGMATSDEEATRAAIREVATWLDLVGNKGSANELRREVDR